MESTTKFIGSFALLFLLIAHLLLLGIFIAPTDVLIASILPKDTDLIEVPDIPSPVEDFLLINNIEVEAEFHSDEIRSRLFLGILDFRRSKFMTESEALTLNLNLLSYGEDIIGIESASQYYFKKPVSEITDAQWITLINLQRIFAN